MVAMVPHRVFPRPIYPLKVKLSKSWYLGYLTIILQLSQEWWFGYYLMVRVILYGGALFLTDVYEGFLKLDGSFMLY